MKEDWRKEFDELCGLKMVGTARTYTKHLDPESVKGFIVLLLTTRTEQAVAEEREKTLKIVKGMMIRTGFGVADLRERFIKNTALEDLLAALQDPRRGGESV